MLWIFFQRSSFPWGSYPKLSFLQFSVREDLTILWNSEAFELLPVLKEKVPKRGATETLKHLKCFHGIFLISSCCTVPDIECPLWLLTEFVLFGCCDTVLSCKNLMCCPTSRHIFCSCAVFSSSLLFMSIKEYIFTLEVLILSPEHLFKTYNPCQGQSCPSAASYIDPSMLGLSFHLLRLFRLTWAFSWYPGEKNPQAMCIALARLARALSL